uniref:Transmembrane protein 232 n=1 Tax=Chelydra serpentina TaxID=8475 RepID=A0A8C3SS74_CHESE
MWGVVTGVTPLPPKKFPHQLLSQPVRVSSWQSETLCLLRFTSVPADTQGKQTVSAQKFIQKFNDATNPQDKEDLLELAKKMLARCKRRSGLGTLGSGKHVDLPVAWTEAIILAQCKGEIQEEALDILLISLDHAPMNPEHVPVLFFIAESILYRICCDAFLVGFFISVYVEDNFHKIIFHAIALSACEVCYHPYPNILSAVHFMLKAGEIICGAVVFSDVSLEERRKQSPFGVCVWKGTGMGGCGGVHA